LISASTLGSVLRAALRDMWPALRSWVWLLLAAVVLVGGGFVELVQLDVLSGSPVALSQEQHLLVVLTSIVIAATMLVASITCTASAVRTVKPEFRMTASRLWGFICWSVVCGLIIMLGLILLIVPGIYLAVRLSQATFLYLLDEGGQNPIDRSFTLTRGRFWITVLVLFVIAVIGEVAAYAAGTVFGFLALTYPASATIAIPAIVLVEFVVFQFTFNAYVRWADTLSAAGVVAA
jgi:hypothetical protein